MKKKIIITIITKDKSHHTEIVWMREPTRAARF